MITNTYEGQLAVSAAQAERLIDGLAGHHDRLWPSEQWSALRLDKPLSVGARGGHGPIRYRVEEYSPGERVRFRFEHPAGFDGHREFIAVVLDATSSILRNALVMHATGLARLSWPLLFEPLHDALIKDGFDKASRQLGWRFLSLTNGTLTSDFSKDSCVQKGPTPTVTNASDK